MPSTPLKLDPATNPLSRINSLNKSITSEDIIVKSNYYSNADRINGSSTLSKSISEVIIAGLNLVDRDFIGKLRTERNCSKGDG